MVRVRLLGELAVESSSGPVELSGSWRARSLFAWLALNPGTHRRAEVAARFWPDVLDSSALASMRNALWTIRRSLGREADQVLLATRDRVGLGGRDLWIDARVVREQMEAGQLADALALCSGELLAGLGDEWIYDYRDAHRDLVCDLLERLATEADQTQEHTAAVAFTRRRVALDPLAEEATRALIVRLAACGDRSGALVAYGGLRDRLRRELGISPSSPTRELVLQIRDEGARVDATEPSQPVAARSAPTLHDPSWIPGLAFPLPPALAHPAPAAFVGRAAEMSTLRRLWSHVAAGQGARIALITGEPGVGKSRLAREFALEAGRDNAIVLYGSADEDLLVPYRHFVDALGHFLAVAHADELQHRVQPRARELEPIMPGLPHRDRGQARNGTRERTRRYQLFEAAGGLLAELSAEVPILMMLDDLHWADQSSIALLRHALESRTDMRLLVVATQRQTEIVPGGALSQAIHRLTVRGLVERVPLSGLIDADLKELSRSLTGRELSAALVHAIRNDTAGNPFFVQELVRHISESDCRAGVLSLARSGIPESVREVVNLRLAPLGEDCMRLLIVAAVLGAEFELEPLQRISDLQGEDLVTALDQAVAAGLLLEQPRGDRERFAFAHALVRRTLLERLSRAHRRRIHARVADALQACQGDGALPEIAHHLCEAMPAVNKEHALDYATRAAEQATADLAYAEAVDLFTRALSLLPPEHERRRTLTLKRALAFQALTHSVIDTPRPEARLAFIATGPAANSVKI